MRADGKTSVMRSGRLTSQEYYTPKERLDVLSRRFEWNILNQHLRRLGLLFPAFLLLLFFSAPSSELDAERVPVENMPMHSFECLPRRFCGTEPNETEPHTQACALTLRVRLRLQAGKGKVGQMAEYLRKAL